MTVLKVDCGNRHERGGVMIDWSHDSSSFRFAVTGVASERLSGFQLYESCLKGFGIRSDFIAVQTRPRRLISRELKETCF